ncbi:NAD(P)H-binding protein [Lysobacter silvisoli]|uniref:NAD-dependent epimerase/dehydratase family protein n=1 Tax=Lysobacter silvisoli TaxID=2293254 RepID=A0A371K0J7_9GAMM|nr:NAD(P)H-binding protein [Lysobacter silvisoli]RDZ27451.1 NAD-dependent epimerase/dehydratase family protein [Lysobacter silvisoli]
MHVIMGGTGHVGSATVETLLAQGEGVLLVTRDADHAARWHRKGAQIVEADINDVPSLHAALKRGKRALLLNPPADVATDTDAVERRTVRNILEALNGTGLEKVVAVSTGGAQPGERLGDLNVLWELEEGLRRQSIPAAINRGAYYMSNWDSQLDSVRANGVLSAMFPADLPIPMVAPADLGRAATARLTSGIDDIGVRYVEGPADYTCNDVAAAFASALNRPVRVEVTPRDQLEQAFQSLGFSEAAATSYARMTTVSIDGGFDRAERPIRGEISLDAYIDALAASL